MESEEIQIIPIMTYPSMVRQLENFTSKYGAILAACPPQTRMPGLKEKGNRVCRFCNKSEDPKAFKEVAHLIPESLGNKFWHSDFECDACNDRFSKYDNSLVNSLGILRTMYGVKGKKGIPAFDSRLNIVRGKHEDIYGVNAFTIAKLPEDKAAFNINMETGQTEVAFFRNKYIPIHVYKSLLKIALSVMPQDDAIHYQYAYKFLLTDTLNHSVENGAKVLYYEQPLHQSRTLPEAWLFRKLDLNAKLPTHYFSFYWKNLVYAFPIPFHVKDIESGLYKDNIDLPACPPFLIVPPTPNETCYGIIKDLASEESVIDDEQSLGFSTDPEIYKQMYAYDPITKEFKKATFKPDEIVKIIIMQAGQQPIFPVNDDQKG